MLLLALAVLATQDIAGPVPNLGAPPPEPVRGLPRRSHGSVADLNDARCEALLRRVSPGSLAAPLGRAGPERVRMYRLLDRRIDGCQAPLIVSDTLPEANAARGRNLAEGRIRRP